MATKFWMVRDVQGFNGFGLPFPNQEPLTQGTTLVASVEQHFTVPSNAKEYLAVFKKDDGSTLFIALNQTAELPGAAFAATWSQQNPQALRVKAGDVLSFITDDASIYVQVVFYDLGSHSL